MRDFKIFLKEMALKTYKVNQFDSDLFTKNDQKVVSHPKTQRTLENILKRTTNFDFNIFIGLPKLSQVRNKNFKKSSTELAQEYCKENNIPLNNHITFFKIESSGEILTPWMLLHGLAHAIFKNDNGENIKNQILSILFKESGLKDNETNRIKIINTIAKNFKFKSARLTQDNPSNKFALNDLNEFVHELFTEYLWHGLRIRTNVSVSSTQQIEQMFHNLLINNIGKILVD